MDYQKIRQNLEQFLSITFLQIEKFDELFLLFKENWERHTHHFASDGLIKSTSLYPPFTNLYGQRQCTICLLSF
jgi:hypothetical protein